MAGSGINIFGDSSTVSLIAVETVAAAEDYIGKLGNLALQLVPPVINPIFPAPNAGPAISVLPPPATQQVVWQTPTVPAPFTGTVDVTSLFPRPFDASPPALVFPAPPTPSFGNVPSSPPIDLNFTYPTVDINLPAAPPLLQLQTYAFNGVNLPTIDTTLPVLTAVSPSIVPYVPGTGYTSVLITNLANALNDRIQDGTNTGLPPAVEQALWDRGRERELRAQADALAELDRAAGLMGFALPPGVYTNARIKIQTESDYTIAGLSREVMIKQAELVQSNILAALETATKLEGERLAYANNVEQRAFESCKYATEAGIAIYNAQVEVFKAYVEAYKTKVTIYEAQIRGALATVEVYKTEIEAEKIKADANLATIQQYKTEVDAALAVIEVFKTQVQIIQTQAEVEKIKIQVFGEQVRAYTGEINAFTAQVEAYRAQIQGETAKEEVYKTQVEAFSAIVGASIKEADALIEQYKGQIQAKLGEIESYRAQIQGQIGQAQAIFESNRSVAAIYSAEVQGQSVYNETLTKEWQVALDQAERVTEIGVQAAKANAELYMTTRSLSLDAAKVGAQVNAQLGAAALSAINWSSHVAFNDSSSFVSSDSNSTTVQTAYIHEQIASA